jgi:uncharacterized protein (DUF849 family)
MLAKSNSELVARAVEIIVGMSGSIASPREALAMLDLNATNRMQMMDGVASTG